MPLGISLPRLRSHIEALSRFGRNPEGQGITRSCWSPAHEEARAWLLDKMKEAGLAILLVEQNLYSALTVADEVYILETGEIAWKGSPADLQSNRSTLERLLGVK